METGKQNEALRNPTRVKYTQGGLWQNGREVMQSGKTTMQEFLSECGS